MTSKVIKSETPRTAADITGGGVSQGYTNVKLSVQNGGLLNLAYAFFNVPKLIYTE